MNAFAGHDVGHADTGREHANPDLARPGFRALLFHEAKRLGAPIAIDDNSCMPHGPASPAPGAPVTRYTGVEEQSIRILRMLSGLYFT